MIKNTLPDESGNSESPKNNRYSSTAFCVHSWRGFAEGVLLAILNIFFHENYRNYNSYRFTCKFAFIFFLPFLTNQKQELDFQQVGGLVTGYMSVFCL